MHRMPSIVVASLVALFVHGAAFSQPASGTRVVLQGYDPVGYFTESKPVKGDPRFSLDWDGGRYYFASARHREMFAANPERYAPQFGGYCTGTMARGARVEADPRAWTIVDGRLHVFGQMRFKDIADKDPGWVRQKLADASKNWRELR